MGTNLEQRAAELMSLATAIRQDALPVRAMILEILSFCSIADISATNEQTLCRVANQVGESSEVVRNVISEFVSDDFRDYSVEYARLQNCFASCPEELRLEVVAMNEQDVKKRPLDLLLHGLRHTWDADSNDFSAIFEGDGPDEREWGDARDGYLVTTGMAFSSHIELLADSSRRQWLGWERLWQLYF